MRYGITVKYDTDGARVEIHSRHQSGLLYVTKADGNWVTTDELRPPHSLAGFMGELMQLSLPEVDKLLRRWGIYYRALPVEEDELPASFME